MGVTWDQVAEALRTLKPFVKQAGLWYTVASERPITEDWIDRMRSWLGGLAAQFSTTRKIVSFCGCRSLASGCLKLPRESEQRRPLGETYCHVALARHLTVATPRTIWDGDQSTTVHYS